VDLGVTGQTAYGRNGGIGLAIALAAEIPDADCMRVSEVNVLNGVRNGAPVSARARKT
jgi:hypothetical protein